MSNDFKLCPSCGKKNVPFVDGHKWKCSACGYTLYCNVAAAVGIIITDDSGAVLFEVRAKEPRKGLLALPGGFCDIDESAEDSVRRECMEEIGLELADVRYLCSFPNTYDYKGVRYKTCDLFFEAKAAAPAADGGLLERLHAQQSEVSGLVMKTINSQEDIDALPLAFDSARKTLRLWLELRHGR